MTATWTRQCRAAPRHGCSASARWRCRSAVRIMNVCGGHERSITMAGLRGALPASIELIPGPGCPVCICPEEDIFEAIQLALNEDITLVAFGDMLRVPVNVPKRRRVRWKQAKAAGADIRPIASPQEAVGSPVRNPTGRWCFSPPVSKPPPRRWPSMVVEGMPENLSLLLSGRLTWPAVAMLLGSGTPGFDALIAPGHVATVMGAGRMALRARTARPARRDCRFYSGKSAGGHVFHAAPVDRRANLPG